MGLAVLLTPAIIGLFWGAPLITRELETGTFRLAWNQSVTRTRWMAVKLGLIGLAAMAATGLFSLMITWWADPIDRVTTSGWRAGYDVVHRLAPLVFDARGITPIGYAAFAFALGITAGVLIRRTLPAMAATLAAFAAVQIALPTGPPAPDHAGPDDHHVRVRRRKTSAPSPPPSSPVSLRPGSSPAERSTQRGSRSPRSPPPAFLTLGRQSSTRAPGSA